MSKIEGEKPEGAESSHADFLIQREKTAVGYHQLGRTEGEETTEESALDEWGNARDVDGKIFSTYTDPEFIRKRFTTAFESTHPDKTKGYVIGDIGGAEGFVGRTIKEQLEADGYEALQLVVADIMEEKIDQIVESDEVDIHGVFVDLLETKLWPDTIDCAVMRYVLPYSSQAQMPQLLSNIYHALAPNGQLIILQDGAKEREKGAFLDQFYAEVTAAQTGKSITEINEHRYFTSGEELAEVAQSLGFKVKEIRELSPAVENPEDRVEGYLSPEAYDSRFKLGEKMDGVTEVFKKWRERMGQKFDGVKLNFTEDPENPDNIRQERSLLYCELEK